MLLLALKHNPINYLTFKMHYVIVGVMSLEINKCYCDMLKATILSLRVLVVGKVEWVQSTLKGVPAMVKELYLKLCKLENKY